MSEPRFKAGDEVSDESGFIGKIEAVHPGQPFPYSIRKPNGVFARHAQTEHMRVADTEPAPDAVNHPPHYGGADNPYEVIKVAEAWGLDKDAYLFNLLKYIGRAGKKDVAPPLQDLKKGRFYLDRRIQILEDERA